MNNNFFIPPCPNWFNSQILACAPDNTLIYGSKNEVVIIYPTAKDESPRVEILPDEGCSQKVVCVDVTPKWDLPNKWVLCSWEDSVVKLWDIKKQQWKKCSFPKVEKDILIGALFLSEDRILSVTESGSITICHIPQLKFTQLSNVFQTKINVTCFATCPHSSHLAAFGLKNGLIIIVDLKKNGTLLHKLRGHTGDVISLSWCPSPINIFPQRPGNLLRHFKELTDKDDTKCHFEKNEDNEKENEILSIKLTEVDVKTHEGNSEDLNLQDKVHLENTKSLLEEKNNSEIKTELEFTETASSNTLNNENLTSCEAPDSCIEELSEKENSENNESLIEHSNPESTSIYQENNCDEEEKNKSPGISEENSDIPFESPDGNISNTITNSEHVEDPKKELLLASCAKDGYINIWRAKTDGRLQCFFKVTEKKSQNKNRKAATSPWLAIKWVTPFSVLFSTRKGELMKLILPKPVDGKKESSVVHNEHSNFIFAIAAHVPILSEKDWFVENEVTIWTFSYDMYILNTVLNTTLTHLTSIETFCALVNCMAYSPVDPNRIALGLSNGTLKIWNANSSSPKFFSTANYSLKIYGKITYVEWHPTNELIIAFCTEEGTVGFINSNNKQKATWFKQFFSSTIHRIQWAPYANKTCLFAIAKGILACFDPDNPKEEPVKLNIQTDGVPYYFSWKTDMSLMLLSHKCGKLNFYDPSLALKASYFNNKKLPFLFWNPESDGEKSFWVASAVDNVVYIFNFAEVAEKSGTLNIDDVLKTKISAHYGNVKSIAWNPFSPDQLVTAGEDGLAFVLDVTNGTILSSFHNDRFHPIKAILWSPIEEDLLIMTMSKFAMLMGWQASKFRGVLTCEILKECENYTKTMKKNNIAVQKEDESAKKIKKVIKSAKGMILPVINTGLSEAGEEKVKVLKQIIEETENKDSVEKSNFGMLFGTKEEVLSLLNISEKSHMNKGKLEAAATVSAFKGDLQNHINEAIGQYNVTPLLISLAPSVSLSLWQKACQTYANQLCGNPDADPIEVALYFLACQNIEQAIEYLCEKELFKEALALAKTRLPTDSVILDSIVTRWAQFSSYCGNLEAGALCYIKLGRYEDAVKTLFRRNDVNTLSLALELALKTKNQELIKAVEFRYNAFSKNNTEGLEKYDLMEMNNTEENSTHEVNGQNVEETNFNLIEQKDKIQDVIADISTVEGEEIKISTNSSVVDAS